MTTTATNRPATQTCPRCGGRLLFEGATINEYYCLVCGYRRDGPPRLRRAWKAEPDSPREQPQQIDRAACSEFGAAMRARRRKRGWTQERLGQECGVRGDWIRRIELGQRGCSQATRERIATALGTTVEELGG